MVGRKEPSELDLKTCDFIKELLKTAKVSRDQAAPTLGVRTGHALTMALYSGYPTVGMLAGALALNGVEWQEALEVLRAVAEKEA